MSGLAPTPTRTAEAWAASGAMAVTGHPDAPDATVPTRLVQRVADLGRRIEAAATALGGERPALDWLALLGERAALDGLRRRGTTSCGGGTRLLRCADGHVAVSLARPSDVDGVDAWLALAGSAPGDGTGDPWARVEAGVADRPGAALARAAGELGIPVGVRGERAPGPDAGVDATTSAAGARPGKVRVLDLSALWAGPLCASLVGAALGDRADVVKVESTARPDASRQGSPALFGLLNAGKRSVSVDLGSAGGRAALAHLVHRADVVVESSRPRALAQLGISAVQALARPGGPWVWVSITGHGRSSPRVAFGDDAAVAGGLVSGTADAPVFCADAVADPLAGLAGAAAALEALAEGACALLDVALAGVAASCAGDDRPTHGLVVAPPRARRSTGEARPFGADTDAVLAGW